MAPMIIDDDTWKFFDCGAVCIRGRRVAGSSVYSQDAIVDDSIRFRSNIMLLVHWEYIGGAQYADCFQ